MSLKESEIELAKAMGREVGAAYRELTPRIASMSPSMRSMAILPYVIAFRLVARDVEVDFDDVMRLADPYVSGMTRDVLRGQGDL